MANDSDYVGTSNTGVIKTYGACGSELDSCHKIYIIQGNVCVIGYLGEGTSREIVSNWDTPFADSSLGAYFKQIGGIFQSGTFAEKFEKITGIATSGMTSQTKLNSRQVWTNNQPYTFNLVLKFRAFSDAYSEVEQAIDALEIMMAPNLSGDLIPGLDSRAPYPVAINFCRKKLMLDCCLRSMSTPYDKEKDANGNLIRADVTLQVETLQAVTKTDLTESRISYARH